MKFFLRFCPLFVLTCLAAPQLSIAQSTVYQSPCSQLVWSDEFDGTTLDPQWTPQIGDGCDINLCGWGNNEAQYYTDRPENLTVTGGNLVITALKETYMGKGYTSARIRSINQGDFTFGRIEARMKMPYGEGSWPAFWMLPTDNTFGSWPTSGEIDIMEFQGKTPYFVSGTVHYGNPIPDNKYKGQIKSLPAGQFYYDDFHVFSIEWDSTQIRWYMDGAQYHTVNKSDVNPYIWPFNERFHILLNMAVGGNLGGPIDDATMPQTFLIDYVRVYTTPLNTAIKGKNKVYSGDTFTYSLPGDPTGNTYVWSVPADATILSGQGTNTISVQWGTTSGNVSVVFTKPCDVFTLNHPVSVFNSSSCNYMFDDFESNRNLTYKSSQGSLINPIANPLKSGYNTSNLVGRYTRSTNTNDAILFTDMLTPDAIAFEAGTKILYMDVVISAATPIGTKIEIQMQNADKATGAFPAGRRNSFIAYTSKQLAWERLVFTYNGTYDATTLPSEIDQLAIIFDPGGTANKIYYFDHIRFANMPQRVVSVATNDTIPCSSTGQQYTVPVISGSSYVWSVPAGATIVSGQNSNQIIVDWGQTGGYVNVTETTSTCTDITGTLRVVLTGCTSTGVNTPVNALQMATVYPNPTHDYATVECELQHSNAVEITVLNAMGEVIWTEKYTGSVGKFQQRISLRNMLPGAYYIRMMSDDGVAFMKLVKD